MTHTASDAEAAERLDHAGRGMLLAWWARRQPAAPAIVAPAGDRTFAQLNGRANQAVRTLRRLGLGAGDGVALLCSNRAEFAEVAAACQRAGWRLTTINWHLTPDEAGYIVDDCEAKALVADASLGAVAAGALRQARACGVALAVGGDVEGFRPYDDELTSESDADIDDPVLGSSMLYTSGTTGRPKGVYRRESPPPATVNLFGYRSGDRHLCTGPLYHAAPLAFSLTTPITYGVGVVLMERWDAEAALALVETHRITHTHMVPTMFHRLLSLPPDVRERYDVSTLRSVLHGAAPCPVAVKRRIIEWLGPVVWEYYAATEGAGCYVDSKTWLSRPGTVGKPIDGQVLIGDAAGQVLPPGETGLVYLKAPAVGRFEYFKDTEKTESSYRGEYFTLGDMGYTDEDGYLFLTDRSADLIISGGVNIYPAEVDAALLEHPSVGDAATIGIPDEEWGERVVAVVELQPGQEASPELAAELVEHCRARLAHFKCPQVVEFIDELPRQDNGKIYKRLLRERVRSGGRDGMTGRSEVKEHAGICDGRVVVVTGAGRGIGRGHALEFSRQGAKVVVNDLGAEVDGRGSSSGPAGAVVDEIRAAGGEAVASGDDVADWKGAERLVGTAVDTYGRLDVLVNNAGILRDRMLVNMTEDEWDAVIQVHLKGTFGPAHFAAEHWRKRSKAGEDVDGRIVNTSSASGIFGNVGQTNYGAAKAGIAAFTIIAAQELGRYGVTVNAIAPGARTRMTENLRGARPEPEPGEFDARAPENVAPLVVWLGSAQSRGVTGQVFLVGGGRIGLARGWQRGPMVDKGARWDPEELSEIVAALLAEARPDT